MKFPIEIKLDADQLKEILADAFAVKPENVSFNITKKYDFRGDECGHDVQLSIKKEADFPDFKVNLKK